MVASSVVSTILILNYHHRNADTHEMSDWVSFEKENQVVGICAVKCIYSSAESSQKNVFQCIESFAFSHVNWTFEEMLCKIKIIKST